MGRALPWKSAGEKAVGELQQACGYDPMGDTGVDSLIAYKDACEDLILSLLNESGDHLDVVNVVEAEDRENPVYVFAELRDAGRFTRAIEPVEPRWLARSNQPIYTGPAAERLIASERGDALEGMGFPAVAEWVREGVSLADVQRRVISGAPGGQDGIDLTREALALLQQWAEEDAKGGEG